MYNKILNYTVRVLIIVFGIVIFFNIPGWRQENENVLRIFGVVMVLFGLYRLIAYHYAVKSQEESDNEDEADNNRRH